jgi:hypothetical protein
MLDAAPPFHLELDPTAIVRAIDTAVVASTEVVNFHFSKLDTADLTQRAEAPNVRVRFTGPNLTPDQRRAMHENWILARAIQELLRAVRHGLEVAHVVTAVVNKKHRVKSDTTLADFLKPFEAKAASLSFPHLLADVNDRLETMLDFADSYKSLQAARNCLEHRAGIVGKPETKGKEEFVISVPRVKIFYMRGAEEIEVEAGQVVKPGEGEDHAMILMRIEERKRTLKLGERLTFRLPEFNEIAFACHHLGAQIVAKLPKPIPIGEGVKSPG